MNIKTLIIGLLLIYGRNLYAQTVTCEVCCKTKRSHIDAGGLVIPQRFIRDEIVTENRICGVHIKYTEVYAKDSCICGTLSRIGKEYLYFDLIPKQKMYIRLTKSKYKQFHLLLGDTIVYDNRPDISFRIKQVRINRTVRRFKR